MDIIRGDGKILNDLELDPKNAHMEVLQNVAIILATIQNTCPMLRNLGLPGATLHRPFPVVKNELVGYVYDQIEMYEPRAIIENVRFEEKGETIITIVELEGVAEDE